MSVPNHRMIVGLEVHVQLKTHTKLFVDALRVLEASPTPKSVRSVWGCLDRYQS